MSTTNPTLQTFFGSAIQGFWVDWTHDTAKGTGDAATDVLTITATLNLFNADIMTGSAGIYSSETGGYSAVKKAFVPYLIIQNTDPTTTVTLTYDAWVWPLDLVATDGAGSALDVLQVQAVAGQTVDADWTASDYTTMVAPDTNVEFTIVAPTTTLADCDTQITFDTY